jgi:S-layer protein (TIGR01567 family)
MNSIEQKGKSHRVLLSLVEIILLLILMLISQASAQQPTENALVRGHFSDGDGVWRAEDFGWFYYDLDEKQGGEMLSVDVDGRTVEKSHIIYTSRAWSSKFKYKPWGAYRSIAFLGKHYLTGYFDSSFTKEVSSLQKGELREVLIDDDDVRTLNYNTSLPLYEGYVLVAKEISQKNGVVNFILLKDKKPVDTKIVSIGGTYVYKIDNFPLILVHLADAMSTGNSGLAEVNGVFQVSDVPYIKLYEGAKLENMEVTGLSEESIELKSNKAITLSRNGVALLVGGLALKVVDRPELIYYPEGGIFDYGNRVLRGPVFGDNSAIPVKMGDLDLSAEARWNTGNFTGFYFDPENNLGDESLIIYRTDGRRVSLPSESKIEGDKTILNGMQYASLTQTKQFDFKPWGNYLVICFLGDIWFAGYDPSQDQKKDSLNLMEHDQLGKVLIDEEIRGKMVAGNYSLEEGYEVRIRDVNKDEIFVQLLKDGNDVDSSVVKSNSTYIYKKNLGDVKDMPIIMVHVSDIFSDGNESFATIDGVFQISDRYIIPVEPGNGIGKLQIVSTSSLGIIMLNNEIINLNRDSAIALAPGLNIRVADNDTLRYTMYTLQSLVPRPKPPRIEYPGNVSSFSQANISMIVPAGELVQVSAEILDPSGKTIYFKDITKLGRGSGDIWGYYWTWNASALVMSDDRSIVLDADQGAVPALLYLNNSSSPIKVSVKFNSSGRIANIADSNVLYYISSSEYKLTNSSLSYGEMLSNSTARKQIIKIQTNSSFLKFFDIINGSLTLGDYNHTITGPIDSIEPHAERIGAPSGRYELRLRIENVVDALRVSGYYFNVTESKEANNLSTTIFPKTGGKSKKSDAPAFIIALAAFVLVAFVMRRV